VGHRKKCYGRSTRRVRKRPGKGRKTAAAVMRGREGHLKGAGKTNTLRPGTREEKRNVPGTCLEGLRRMAAFWERKQGLH